MAIIRPPGHHAEADEACGFCIFNNVPVAGMYLFSSKKIYFNITEKFQWVFSYQIQIVIVVLIFHALCKLQCSM